MSLLTGLLSIMVFYTSCELNRDYNIAGERINTIQKTITFGELPVLSCTFTQYDLLDDHGLPVSGSSKLTLEAGPYSPQGLANAAFSVRICGDSLCAVPGLFSLVNIPLAGTSGFVLSQNTLNKISGEDIHLDLLRYPGGNPFGNVFEGYYKGWNASGADSTLVEQGAVHGYLTAEGTLMIFSVSPNQVRRVEGQVAEDGTFTGAVYNTDGLLSRLTVPAKVSLSDSALSFRGIMETTGSDTLNTLWFNLTGKI